MTRGLCIACLLSIAIRPAARAAGGSGDAAMSPTVAPTVVEEAQASFRAGVEWYEAGDYGAALEEFERAYRLAPTYKILFNLAQVAYQRRDYATALRSFSRYLDEGGASIESDRRAEVEREIVRLRPRVGEVRIVGGEAGSDIFVDDVRVGITPMANPVAVTVGRRRLEIVDLSGRRQIRHVEVTAGGRLRVTFTADSPRTGSAAATPPVPPPPPKEPPAGPALPALLSVAARPPVSAASDAGRTARSSWAPWVAWGLTAVAGGVAVFTGRRAFQSASALERELNDYPIHREDLDGLSADRRRWTLATDGALLGTAILGAIALYVTTSRAASGPTPSASAP